MLLLEGDGLKGTGPTIPAGEALLGRVVDPLGRPVAGLDPPSSPSPLGGGRNPAAAVAAVPLNPQGVKGHAPLLHRPSPGIMARKPLCARLVTGVKAVDVFHPLAHGQCFAVLGRFGSGKTALALEVIAHQRGGREDGAEEEERPLRCVYVAIGQVSFEVCWWGFGGSFDQWAFASWPFFLSIAYTPSYTHTPIPPPPHHCRSAIPAHTRPPHHPTTHK